MDPDECSTPRRSVATVIYTGVQDEQDEQEQDAEQKYDTQSINSETSNATSNATVNSIIIENIYKSMSKIIEALNTDLIIVKMQYEAQKKEIAQLSRDYHDDKQQFIKSYETQQKQLIDLRNMIQQSKPANSIAISLLNNSIERYKTINSAELSNVEIVELLQKIKELIK